MTRLTRAAALAIPLLLSACAWRRTPVPLASETGSVALLVGTWSGEYSSTETRRSGSISFELASEKDTAFCDITMIPKIQSIQVHGDRSGQIASRPQIPEALKVQFIRLGDGKITGTLDPYVDPESGSRITTTFNGRFVRPDRIEGTFTSRAVGQEYLQSRGRWAVTRQKAIPAAP